MSKIQNLLKDNENILVFDVDGVLAKIEYGKYNHYLYNDEDWSNSIISGDVYYTEKDVSLVMQNFLKTKDMNNIFICSKVMNEKEKKLKEDFLMKYYNIHKENIYFVYENKEKINILKVIHEKHLDKKSYQIAMIDDSIEVLNSIHYNSNFSTIHVSSFL